MAPTTKPKPRGWDSSQELHLLGQPLGHGTSDDRLVGVAQLPRCSRDSSATTRLPLTAVPSSGVGQG